MGKYSAARDLDLAVRTRWYLVANRTGAVIYRDRDGHPFEFVERLTNPRGRLRECEMDSDRAGRGAASAAGSQIRHALVDRNVTQETVAQRFADEIAEKLARASAEERFTRLVVVAEPHFLGLLRRVLPQNVKKLIEHEIPREISQGSDEEIREYILKKMA